MSMSGINALPSYYPLCGNLGGQGTLASQSSPYNIEPVSIPNYLPSLPADMTTRQMALNNRLISTYPSSLYVNVPDSVRAMSGQMQDMVNLRNQSAMYAGLLNGVNHFNSCVGNIANNQPNQNPPMSEQPFRIWQAPTSPQGKPVQVPVQQVFSSLGAEPIPFGGDALGACAHMLDVCLTQLLQCQQNLAVLRNQMTSMGQAPVAFQPVQQAIQPFMVPMGQMMAHVQAAPMMSSAQMPVLNSYLPRTPIPIQAGAMGQYYFEPVLNTLPMSMPALAAACPQYHHMPMQSMPGWLPFANGFSHFVAPGNVEAQETFTGTPLVYKPRFAQKQQEPLRQELDSRAKIPNQQPSLSGGKPEHESIKGPQKFLPNQKDSLSDERIPTPEVSAKESLSNESASKKVPVDSRETHLTVESLLEDIHSPDNKGEREGKETLDFESASIPTNSPRASTEVVENEGTTSIEDPKQGLPSISSSSVDTAKPKNTSLKRVTFADNLVEINRPEESPPMARSEDGKGKYDSWQLDLVACCQSGQLADFNAVINSKSDDYSLNDALPGLNDLTPLGYVAQEGKYLSLVSGLLDNGADPQLGGASQKNSPLLIAAESGGEDSAPIVKALLSALPKGSDAALDNEVLALRAAYVAKRNSNVIAVLETLKTEPERKKCIEAARLTRNNFKGLAFDTLLGVNPDGVKEAARTLHEEFIKACEKCDHETLNSSYNKLKKQWADFNLHQNYEGKDSPLQVICASKGFVEDQVIAIGQMKALIDQQANDSGIFEDITDSLPEYQSRFKHRKPDQRKLLTMALLATSGSEVVAKVESNSDRYKANATPAQSAYRRYSNSTERTWVKKSNNSDWRTQLNSWDQREMRLSNPALSENDLKEHLKANYEKGLEQQAVDDGSNTERDRRFLESRTSSANSKKWWSLPGKLASTAAAPINKTFKIKGREFTMTALADSHIQGRKGLSSYLKKDLPVLLEESLKKKLGERRIQDASGVRDALKLCLVDVNHQLGKLQAFDLTGLDITLLLSFKNENKTELWTVTLGEAITALLHPDGRTEQLSVDAPGKNKVLGYNILNVGTSARGKVTRRVLDKTEDPAAITICQFNGNIRKQAGLQAISELARRLETPSPEQSEGSGKAVATIPGARKQARKDKQKRGRVAAALPRNKVSHQKFTEAVIARAGNESEHSSLLMQAVPLSGNRKTLPPRALSVTGVANRVHFLNTDDSYYSHSKQEIEQLVREIKSSAEQKGRDNLLLALYVELLSAHGELGLEYLPDGIVTEIRDIPALKAMNEAETLKDRIAVLTDRSIDVADAVPLAKLYRYQVVQHAEKCVGNDDFISALEPLFFLTSSIESCLDLRAICPAIAPYLDSLSNSRSLLWEAASEAWTAKEFANLLLDKLDKRLAPFTDGGQEYDSARLAEQAGYDETTCRLMLARYRDTPLAFIPKEGEDSRAFDLIEQKKEGYSFPERMSNSVRVDVLREKREVIDSVIKLFNPSDNVEPEHFPDLDLKGLARDVCSQGIEFDSPCFIDRFRQPASFLELLIDSQMGSQDLTDLLEDWWRVDIAEQINSLNYLISKLEKVEDNAVDGDDKENIGARRVGLQNLLEKVTAKLEEYDSEDDSEYDSEDELYSEDEFDSENEG